jgi:hypothetical protein
MCKHVKADIMAWLSSKHILHTASQTRAEFLQPVKMNMLRKCHELDITAMQHENTVVQLLPYHCHYNPTELIRVQVKSYVADKNYYFRNADMEKLTHEAVDKIQILGWNDCMQHAEKFQEDDLQKYISRDSLLEPIIVKLRDSDSEEPETSEEDD